MKVLYFIDKKSKKKPRPKNFVTTSSLKEVYSDKFPIVVFDEATLKKKKINPVKLEDKICFIYFDKEAKSNLKTVERLGFFGYLSTSDSKGDINFKIKRAQKLLSSRDKIEKLEKEVIDKKKEIEKGALVDPLSGCYNWRYFMHRAQQEISRSRRHLYDVSFIALDIDYFRQINEVYGVKIADAVIKKVVSLLKTTLRKEDSLCRWRDDEFFIVLPYLSRRYAHIVAKRIKNKVAKHKFKFKKLTLTIKVSAGVVSFPEDKIYNTNDLISALSESLSIAKRNGGDKVILYYKPKVESTKTKKKKENIAELQGHIRKLNVLLTRDLLEMIYGFARAIEAKDSYTGKHVEFTAAIAEKVAKRLHLPKSEAENVKRAAVLHDLGKVAIEESILLKRGKLTKKERDRVRTHPWIAAEILKEIHALRGAIPAILYHHERYDGAGYPLGLKGEEIPLGARIVAIADVYQALVSNRPYRKAMKKRKALDVIKQEKGKHFDPKVLDAFLDVIKHEK